ncbi:MAG: hypothetical protein OXU28_05285 [Chloroflexota bacterium]|nr:hypothetical protein [Chloroflexota bacterium]
MSIREAGHPGRLRDIPAGDGTDLFRQISQAVFGAIVEDWTAESLELYRTTQGTMPLHVLPDDTIEKGSRLENQMIDQLAGGHLRPAETPAGVRDYLFLAVSGSKVLEDESALCRVVWVSSGEVAEPVFTLLPQT